MGRPGQHTFLSRRNEGASGLRLWIEPWAEEFEIAAGSRFDVAISDAANADPEVVESTDQVTIYAPAGAVISVSIDGIVQDSASSELPVPCTGSLATRGFVNLVFGDFQEARPGGMPRPKEGTQWRRWLHNLLRL